MDNVIIKIDFQLTPESQAALAELKGLGGGVIDEATSSMNELSKAADNVGKTIAAGAADEQIKEITKATEEATTKTVRLTTQLRAMRQQLAEMEQGGQGGTKAFRDLATAAGKLDDQIRDTSARVRALGSDTKNLDAAVQVVTGLAGAFSIAQGAAALLGKDNEALQKALVKVQASMAILNGLQAVAATLQKESAASLGVLRFATAAYNLVVGQSTGALKIFKLALAGTGVGLLILAIGALVQNFDKVKAKLLELFPSLANLGNVFKTVGAVFSGVFNAVFDGIVGIGSAVKDLFKGNFREAVADIKNIDLAGAFKEGFNNAVNAVDTGGAEVEKAVQDHVDRLGEIMKRQIQQIKDTEAGILEAIRAVSKEEIAALPGGTTALSIEEQPEVLLTKQIADKKVEINQDGLKQQLEDNQQFAQAAASIVNALFDYGSQINQNEINALEDKHKRGLISEGNYTKQLAALKKKQAIADKEKAIFNSVISTAQAILSSSEIGYPAAIPFVAAAAAIGAIELGIILAQPIPKFAKGTRRAPAGFKLVGEEGPELLYDQGGYQVIPNDRSEAIMAMMDPYKPIDLPSIPDEVLATGHYEPINYDLLAGKLAEKIGDKFERSVDKIAIHKDVYDDNGHQRFLIKDQDKTEYKNKRYNF